MEIPVKIKWAAAALRIASMIRKAVATQQLCKVPLESSILSKVAIKGLVPTGKFILKPSPSKAMGTKGLSLKYDLRTISFSFSSAWSLTQERRASSTKSALHSILLRPYNPMGLYWHSFIQLLTQAFDWVVAS